MTPLAVGSAGNALSAIDYKTGKTVWRIGNISNAPQTYLLDGRQHVLVAVGDTVFAFALY